MNVFVPVYDYGKQVVKVNAETICPLGFAPSDDPAKHYTSFTANGYINGPIYSDTSFFLTENAAWDHWYGRFVPNGLKYDPNDHRPWEN